MICGWTIMRLRNLHFVEGHLWGTKTFVDHQLRACALCCSRNDHLYHVAMRHVMCDWYSKRTEGAVLTLGERKGLLRCVLKRSCVCPRDESRSGSVRSETNSGSRVPWAVAYRAPLASRAGRCGSCRETRRSCLVTT